MDYSFGRNPVWIVIRYFVSDVISDDMIAPKRGGPEPHTLDTFPNKFGRNPSNRLGGVPYRSYDIVKIMKILRVVTLTHY